ncbi:hypothetical protein D3C76_1620560 [compost metagenome]
MVFQQLILGYSHRLNQIMNSENVLFPVIKTGDHRRTHHNPVRIIMACQQPQILRNPVRFHTGILPVLHRIQ